jgi:2-polyprenyl-6-methoxyphenol hydroxylase-like FAD-dependent oxidoreductase
VLQHLGIYHEVYEDGFTYEELTVSNARSQRLATMMQGSKERYNFPCLRTHRAKVQKALLRELKKQEIAINFGKRLVSLEERGLFVDMTFEDGSKATANFVIGADGVHSRVRDLIMDVNMDYSGFMGIIGMAVPKKMVHKSVNDVKLPNFIFGKTGFVAIMPSNYDGTEVDFFSTLPYPVQTREEWAKMNDDKPTLQSIIKERFGKDWPEYVTRLVHDFDNQGLQLFP